MKYFSMFSGIGGFELAIQRVLDSESTDEKFRQTEPAILKRGFGSSVEKGTDVLPLNGERLRSIRCVGYSEIDDTAIKIYEKHFKGHKNYGNAERIIPEEIPDFDFLCGGFPCQSFSIAGKRGGFEDTRGTLFFEIARVLSVKRPAFLLLENVRGLLSHDNGTTFGTILSTLSRLGYILQWQILNSKSAGVPQNRERVFIVGHTRERSFPKVFPITESYRQPRTLQQEAERKQQGFSSKIPQGHREDERSESRGQGSKRPCSGQLEQVGNVDTKGHNSIWGRVYSPDGISANLNAEGGGLGAKTGLYLTKDNVRRLTPTECERLQGFPDGWTKGFPDNARYKCLGNAVTVNIVEEIIYRLKSAIL